MKNKSRGVTAARTPTGTNKHEINRRTNQGGIKTTIVSLWLTQAGGYHSAVANKQN
ncbi:hypothetical protein J6590_032829 [Homalodisca vitripennis]|nr:hypothetical protein J6590_032829 [Homalodisca vitripennis]